MKTIRWCGSVAVFLSLIGVALAQAPALAVKMGLWELTATTRIGGQMPTIDTSRFTPEQKAKVEAMMKGMAQPHSRTGKTCMTREKFEKSAFLIDDEPDSTCTQTLTTNTRKTLESTVQCTGEHSSSAQMHIDALSPTSIKGTIKRSDTEDGRTVTANIVLTAKWLGTDCQGVK